MDLWSCNFFMYAYKGCEHITTGSPVTAGKYKNTIVCQQCAKEGKCMKPLELCTIEELEAEIAKRKEVKPPKSLLDGESSVKYYEVINEIYSFFERKFKDLKESHFVREDDCYYLEQLVIRLLYNEHEYNKYIDWLCRENA